MARGAFSLVELLVVVAVLSLLMAIVVPSLRGAKELARRVSCMANLKSLGVAWQTYAARHDGALLSAWAGGGETAWVGAGNTVESIEGGALYPHVSGARGVYRCPSDTTDHYRSYSICDFIGGVSWGNPPLWESIRRIDRIPRASDAMVFLEEDDARGYNMGSWVVYPTGDKWIDPIPSWHNLGATFWFASGHVEYWRWRDERTTLLGGRIYQVTVNNPDLRRVQAAACTAPEIGG